MNLLLQVTCQPINIFYINDFYRYFYFYEIHMTLGHNMSHHIMVKLTTPISQFNKQVKYILKIEKRPIRKNE